ncbi:MarR family winged helix-turn-helix transcriptional regulator [uncultured Jatrophihabitans sp.]|uniref:MarR family winged helix-turn-helix transcriptional regulator n=1 Tax=uncultured Jatrophihabitans sp. TaxID=1610747 RepID=UPI0035CAD325
MTDVAQRPIADVARRQRVSTVANHFIRLIRASNKARARFLDEVGDAERSAHIILRLLQNEGPLRASAVAEHLYSDPSTVSRQVAELVKGGLLERESDPADGRASLLVLTDAAAALLARHDELRNQHFAALLADWTDEELAAFGEALRRFGDDYVNAQSPSWPGARPPAQPATPTSNPESDH